MNEPPSYEKDLKENYDKIDDLYIPKDFQRIVKEDEEILKNIFDVIDTPNEQEKLIDNIFENPKTNAFFYKERIFRYTYSRFKLINFLPLLQTLIDDDNDVNTKTNINQLIEKYIKIVIENFMGKTNEYYEKFKNKTYDEKNEEFDKYFKQARHKEIEKIKLFGEKIIKESDEKIGIITSNIPNLDEENWVKQMKEFSDSEEREKKIKLKEQEKKVQEQKQILFDEAIKAAKEEDERRKTANIEAEKLAQEKAADAKKKAEEDAAAAKKAQEEADAAKKVKEEADAAKKAQEEAEEKFKDYTTDNNVSNHFRVNSRVYTSSEKFNKFKEEMQTLWKKYTNDNSIKDKKTLEQIKKTLQDTLNNFKGKFKKNELFNIEPEIDFSENKANLYDNKTVIEDVEIENNTFGEIISQLKDKDKQMKRDPQNKYREAMDKITNFRGQEITDENNKKIKNALSGLMIKNGKISGGSKVEKPNRHPEQYNLENERKILKGLTKSKDTDTKLYEAAKRLQEYHRNQGTYKNKQKEDKKKGSITTNDEPNITSYIFKKKHLDFNYAKTKSDDYNETWKYNEDWRKKREELGKKSKWHEIYEKLNPIISHGGNKKSKSKKTLKKITKKKGGNKKKTFKSKFLISI